MRTNAVVAHFDGDEFCCAQPEAYHIIHVGQSLNDLSISEGYRRDDQFLS